MVSFLFYGLTSKPNSNLTFDKRHTPHFECLCLRNKRPQNANEAQRHTKFQIFCNTLHQDNRLSLCIFWLVHFCFHAIRELTHLLANNGYFSSDQLVTQSVACLICGILWVMGAGAAKQTHRDMLVPLCRLYGYVWNRCTAELNWRKKFSSEGRKKRSDFVKIVSFKNGKPVLVSARKLDAIAIQNLTKVTLDKVSCSWSTLRNFLRCKIFR